MRADSNDVSARPRRRAELHGQPEGFSTLVALEPTNCTLASTSNVAFSLAPISRASSRVPFRANAEVRAITSRPSVRESSSVISSASLYMANYQFCLSARVFDLLIPLLECAISLFYSFI